MKILSSLLGLVIFLAGIYLTYWVYLDFESFETLYLGLYLGGSFVLMTLGFFLFLLPLTMKSKKSNVEKVNKETITQSFTSNNIDHEEVIEEHEIEISEIDAIKLVQEDVEDEEITINHDINQSTLELEESNIIEDIEQIALNNDELSITHEIIQNDINDAIEQPFHTVVQETSQFTINIPLEIIELRVIGIESWSSQNILRKLSDQSKLEISQKSKAGINMTQVTYKQKLIGYISRLDMNKINHKLSQLVEVTPATLVREGHKIEHFSVNLKFKNEVENHE